MAAADRKDPLTSFNFIVNIPGVGIIGCSEVGGLTGETDIVEYRTGDEPPRYANMQNVDAPPMIACARNTGSRMIAP